MSPQSSPKNKWFSCKLIMDVTNGRSVRSLAKEMGELLRMGDSVTQWKPEYWNESFNKPEKEFIPAKGFCSFVFNNVTLSSSGEVSKCCMDLKGSTVYSDLRKNTLAQIWHSDIRKNFLSLMFKNDRSRIEGCSKCSITNVNNDNRYKNIVKTARRKLAPILKGKDYYLKPAR